MYIQSCYQFLDYIKIVRNCSDHTLRNYALDLNLFKKFLLEHFSKNEAHTNLPDISHRISPAPDFFSKVDDIDIHLIDRKLLRGFLAHLHQQGQTKRTIARRLSSLRSFFKFSISRSLIEKDPCEDLDSLKLDKKIPIQLSYEEVKRFFDQPDLATLFGVRDRTILELFYSSGLRLSELVALNHGDIDFEKQTVKLKGKGRKERLIPVTPSACAWVQAYIAHPEREANVDDAIFLNKHGTRLSARSIDRHFEKYLATSGLSAHITPHALRHAIATAWLENGMNLKTIQLLLGHSSLATTTIYTQVSSKYKREVYEKTHPRA